MNRHWMLMVALAMPLALSAGPTGAASSVPAYVTSALNAPGRPPDDRVFDASRKVGDTLAYSLVKPGDAVADIEPDGDLYYPRIFSKIVGPKGHVYLFVPSPGYPAMVRGNEEKMRKAGKELPPNPVDIANQIMDAADYKNVTVIWQTLYLTGGQFSLPVQIDVVFSHGSYNDWHNKEAGDPKGNPLDMKAIDKAIFQTVKAGGTLYIADKAGAAGSGFSETETAHTADPAAVRNEITAAGFTFDGQSNLLAGKGEYILRFKKPASARGDKRPPDSALANYYGNTLHGGVGGPVQRWDMYHPDHTYQEYGNTGTRVQQATWYWDARGLNCHIHEFPADERSFTDCHTVDFSRKPGDQWKEGNRGRALEKGYTYPAPQVSPED